MQDRCSTFYEETYCLGLRIPTARVGGQVGPTYTGISFFPYLELNTAKEGDPQILAYCTFCKLIKSKYIPS